MFSMPETRCADSGEAPDKRSDSQMGNPTKTVLRKWLSFCKCNSFQNNKEELAKIMRAKLG